MSRHKKVTPSVIKSIAGMIESYTAYGEEIKLIEIYKELMRHGYDVDNVEKTHDLIRKTLQDMGWKLNRGY